MAKAAMELIKAHEHEKVATLLKAMLEGVVPEIRPLLDLQSELGFSFPFVNQLLATSDKESNALLESLADQGLMVRKFFDKFLYCPQCRSLLLRPSYNCAKCGSGNIARGRVLEHLSCKYLGLDDEFLFRGRLICPRCKLDLRTLDVDYRSLGVLYQCRDCRDISPFPAIRWRCLKCASLTSADKVLEINAYSYSLNEEKRNMLKFEIQSQPRLVHFLEERGYKVEQNGKLPGRSGIEHTFPILATRSLGILIHRLAIGVEIARSSIDLDKVFDFDDKAYDCGISFKVLVAIPGLTAEAERFAARQRIRVLDSAGLEKLLATALPPAAKEEAKVPEEKPVQFASKTALIRHLQSKGYEVRENGKVKGQSAAEHSFHILATRDDGLIVHNIVVDIEVAGEPLGIDKIFEFDAKAYDCVIPDKVLIAVPGLTQEAARFARRQRIKVFEAAAVSP